MYVEVLGGEDSERGYVKVLEGRGQERVRFLTCRGGCGRRILVGKREREGEMLKGRR